MINFTIDENYVITAIEIDGVTYTCSIQIAEGWEPYLMSYSVENDALTDAIVGDANDDSNFGTYGDCSASIPEESNPMEPIPVETYTVTILYDGTKYTNMKCWHDYIWFTDRNIGNPLWSDGSEYLKYTVGYAPVNLQLTKVVKGEVVEESEVYIARGSGTWVVHDDGTWERYEEPKGKE